MVSKAVTITLIVVAAVVIISLPLTIPVLGFQFLFWRMHLILDNTPQSELIERTEELPEVKAFLAKYENASAYINTDYHIGVDYSITECELTGQHCNNGQPYAAFLHVRISLDTGYPEFSRFACGDSDYGRSPLGDEALIRAINDCH
jgi:hypothetical protein